MVSARKGCFFMLLKECKEEFLYDCSCRHLTKGTIRNYSAGIRFLVEFLEKQNITEVEQVQAAHIRKFLKMKQEDGCTPNYINDLLKDIKVMFNYLENEDYIIANPAQKVKGVSAKKVIIESFTEAEIKRLIGYFDENNYLDIRNKTMIALLFDTGARCNEMITMEPEDIFTDYIVIRHGKGNKERIVPKSPYLGKLLFKYQRIRNSYFKEKPTRYNNLFLSKTGKPLTDEAVAKMLKKAASAVSVNENLRVSPHTCRHTFAHLQLKNGLDIYSLSRLMGHANISITQRYLQGIKDCDIVGKSNRSSPLMNL